MKRIILYGFMVAMAFSCSEGGENTSSPEENGEESNQVRLTEAQIRHAGIEVGNAEQKPLAATLQLYGSIDVPPLSMVSVSCPLGGYLKKTNLISGMPVQKGKVLGVVENVEFIQLQQDYLSVKERLKFSEREYLRQAELNASKASSDKVLQQAEMEKETQRVNLRALEQKLRLIGIDPDALDAETISREIRIVSPIDGFVSKVNVNTGKYVSPTDVLFELVNPKDIHLKLSVFEKDIHKLQVGQKVMAYPNNDTTGEKYETEIILIDKSFSNDRIADVHCHFRKIGGKLLPGMYMNAEVQVKEEDGLTVHEEAVVRWQDRFYVFVEKQPDMFEMQPVVIGNRQAGQLQITASGVDVSSRIVTRNAYALLMKMKNSGEED